MRLINVHTLELELFTDSECKDRPYAILSHTWDNEEVSFQDMQSLCTARSKRGFAKIEATCRLALHHGVDYAWVDTCCIDKTSSAELSEAINSMFRWYENSYICYAFLFDVSAQDQMMLNFKEFRDCRWFTRGWCLQELIAPKDLRFFNKDWVCIGTKHSLRRDIETVTGIHYGILIGMVPFSSTSLATRMCWAAKRQTTRIEDRAYSLLGLFDVNMTMIYGEGSKAFIRLQEEILKTTTDLSLLSWKTTPGLLIDMSERRNTSDDSFGILADSPDKFLSCTNIELDEDQFRLSDELTITNKGLKLTTDLENYLDGLYILNLHCYQVERGRKGKRLGIYLKRELDTFFRWRRNETPQPSESHRSLARPIYLGLTMRSRRSDYTNLSHRSRCIYFGIPEPTSGFRVDNIVAVPEAFWHADGRYFSIRNFSSFMCFVRFRATFDICSSSINGEFILVFNLTQKTILRAGLLSKDRLQNSSMPQNFIDPFNNIEEYGSLGDPFSLSLLSCHAIRDSKLNIICGNDHDHLLHADVCRDRTDEPFEVWLRLTTRTTDDPLQPTIAPIYS